MSAVDFTAEQETDMQPYDGMIMFLLTIQTSVNQMAVGSRLQVKSWIFRP